MLMFNVYKNLRRIIEKTTGYPCDPILAKEYLWAWKYTGIRPKKVICSEKGTSPTFSFQKGHVIYFCCADRQGKYSIGNVDTDGFFHNNKYMKRAYLIAKYLGNRPNDCSKKEAVSFCIKAIRIEKSHGHKLIDTSKIPLNTIQHAIISFA